MQTGCGTSAILQPFDATFDLRQKIRFIEHVGRVVAGQRQLRENQQRRARGHGRSRGLPHQRNIAVNIPDRRIDLRQGDGERFVAHDFPPDGSGWLNTCRKYARKVASSHKVLPGASDNLATG